MDVNLRYFLSEIAPPRLDPSSRTIVFYGKDYKHFISWMTRYNQTAPDALVPKGRGFISEDGIEYIFLSPNNGSLCGRSIRAYIISHEWVNYG